MFTLKNNYNFFNGYPDKFKLDTLFFKSIPSLNFNPTEISGSGPSHLNPVKSTTFANNEATQGRNSMFSNK